MIIFLFILGYIGITFGYQLKINKAATALITGVLCWTVYGLYGNADIRVVLEELNYHVVRIAGILFFLLGAMVVVEIIDAHNGFELVTARIQTNDKKRLLWLTGFFTFFLSAILDNLTTTIVMVSLLRKLIADRDDRLLFVGLVIVAANAGGAFSPIGDVTTTMLWTDGQITALNIVKMLFIPSLLCLLVTLAGLARQVTGVVRKIDAIHMTPMVTSGYRERNTVFIMAIGSLLFVPLFHSMTHLPQFMAMLFGLGIIWILTELIHAGKDDEIKSAQSVAGALQRIDTPSILFFMGILLAVAALQSAGILSQLADWLNKNIGNQSIIVMCLGGLSAVVDNVPLVAAAKGMYSLKVYPPDHFLWEFIAYCTGTGGSMLIIGSAAGVAAMGMERIDFFWYLRRIAPWALLGYLTGAMAYMVQYSLFN